EVRHTRLLGEGAPALRADRVLLGEEGVVQALEAALLGGALGRERRIDSVRMDVRERIVAVDDGDTIRVPRAHLAQGHPGARAERTLEVGELDDRHRSAPLSHGLAGVAELLPVPDLARPRALGPRGKQFPAYHAGGDEQRADD